jgi:hypothetical protein
MTAQTQQYRQPVQGKKPQEGREKHLPAEANSPGARDDRQPPDGLRHQEHEYRKGDSGGLVPEI